MAKFEDMKMGKDKYNLSPAANPDWNYMDCVVKVSKLNNDMDMEPVSMGQKKGPNEAE
jgi:hypothetical protein